MCRRCALASALAGALALAASSLAAQEPPDLTVDEAAQIRVDALRAILDRVNHPDPPGRIWIESTTYRSFTSEPWRPVDPPVGGWPKLAEAFPTARLAGPSDTLFLCPPGVDVRPPLSGCPIRDDGVIVRFEPLQIRGDSVRVDAQYVHSFESSGGGHDTVMRGVAVLFRRVREAWRLVAFHWIMIT